MNNKLKAYLRLSSLALVSALIFSSYLYLENTIAYREAAAILMAAVALQAFFFDYYSLLLGADLILLGCSGLYSYAYFSDGPSFYLVTGVLIFFSALLWLTARLEQPLSPRHRIATSLVTDLLLLIMSPINVAFLARALLVAIGSLMGYQLLWYHEVRPLQKRGFGNFRWKGVIQYAILVGLLLVVVGISYYLSQTPFS
jgi:hypothetical protein